MQKQKREQLKEHRILHRARERERGRTRVHSHIFLSLGHASSSSNLHIHTRLTFFYTFSLKKFGSFCWYCCGWCFCCCCFVYNGKSALACVDFVPLLFCFALSWLSYLPCKQSLKTSEKCLLFCILRSCCCCCCCCHCCTKCFLRFFSILSEIENEANRSGCKTNY